MSRLRVAATAAAVTLDEIRTWPATVSIPTAVGPIGISRSYGFELAKRGEFPCRLIKVGSRYRVITSSLVDLLDDNADRPAPRTAGEVRRAPHAGPPQPSGPGDHPRTLHRTATLDDRPHEG